eukprot:CAMPEP_0172544680 /NCGR_PEP_ID=MMETSP1067-20121228/14776_1 /TAXON_ID=265564 ORGANISM="Thalassiosira punctigera, Strain Tpunct2005C2" /NCGR_SAMPLE_ID=MMETSP1067 /ASSEMBLY_ACC=CAM_ASM_000444 /LENGTH=505 /DNA_ID=CAMNT_0013331279 /DNA_START=99 /DNA_END=1616 /DNA_ORIENTATION=+
MAFRIHRIAIAAAALGDGCAAFREARLAASSFVPNHKHFVPKGAAGVSARRSPSILAGRCRDCERGDAINREFNAFSIPQRRSPRTTTIMFMSTVDHGEETLELSNPTTYESDDLDDDDESDDRPDDSVDDSRSSVLLEALTKSVRSALKQLSKKITSLQRELAKAQSLEETMNRANLIVSNLYRLPPGTTSAEVEDWENDGRIVELVLNTKDYGSAQEEADTLFALARKMKRGSRVVEDLLAESLDGEKILNDAMLDLKSMADDGTELDEGTLVLIQERMERTSKKTGFQSPDLSETNEMQQNSQVNKTRKRISDKARDKPNPRELTSPSGLRVLVGRNRRDNEAICFQLSKPTDIWMHSRGCPGAHVLLCVRRGGPEVKDEDLQFAADLAAFYSDARTEVRAKITTAEPKHITKPRGAPMGAVSLRKEGKTLVGRPENVSVELKEARERSGAAWDEMGYRKLGTRAKNKKKTSSAEKAKREKKREEAKGKNKRRKRKEEQDWY